MMIQDQSTYVSHVSKNGLLESCFEDMSHPVVQFCNISKYVIDSSTLDQPEAWMESCDTSAIQNDNLDADFDGVSRASKLEEELWIDYGDEDEDNEELIVACGIVSSSMLNIKEDDGVDVSVPQLQDFLSDTPALSLFASIGEGSNMMRKTMGSERLRFYLNGHLSDAFYA